MSVIKRVASKFRTGLQIISKFSLFAIMALVFISSIGRYLFGQTIPNIIKIVQLVLLPTVIWLYAPEVQFTESNITMDLVSNRISESTRRIVKLLFYPFVLGILLLAFDSLLNSTITLWEDQVWTSGAISLPAFGTRGLITAGVLMLAATIALQIVMWIRELVAESRFSGIGATQEQSND